MGSRRLRLGTMTVLLSAALWAVAGCDAPSDTGTAGTPAAATAQPAPPPSPSPPTTVTATEPSPPQTTADPSTAPSPPPAPPVAAGDEGTVQVDGRPVTLVVPASYDGSPAPLLVALHGFGSGPEGIDGSWPLRAAAAEQGVLLVLPAGTEATDGRRFWNAGDACCNFDRSDVDDSGFLADVVREVLRAYAVDPARVALVGHSNGGFMAYRAACDHADLITHVASVAGAMPADPDDCDPARAVSVVQVHGTDDLLIPYDGGDIGLAAFPSAQESVAGWARLDQCGSGPTQDGRPLDLDVVVEGAETTVSAYGDCDGGVRVELWTVAGAGHGPAFGDAFADQVLAFVTGDDPR